jgi:hypothetical protein
MEAPSLEWSAAAVQDGVVTVQVAGDRPKGWKATFLRTVTLLGAGDWGTVSVKGAKVRVADVPEGSEDELRHFLEAAVQQANASHVEPDEDADDRSDESETDDEGDDDDVDARMTSRFRDFGAG